LAGGRVRDAAFLFLRGRKTRSKTYVAHTEERFIAQEACDGAEYLSAQAGAFAGGEREKKGVGLLRSE